MQFGKLLRAFEAVVGLTEVVRRFKAPADDEAPPDRPRESLSTTSRDRMLGQFEARLTGVVVAALKEAFDRDRARLDLERAQIDAESQRAEERLRLELLRQAADREIAQLRMFAAVATGVWITSAVVAIRFAGALMMAPRVSLGIGWLLLVGCLAAAAIGYRQLAVGLTGAQAEGRRGAYDPANARAAVVAPWLLVGGLGFTALSLVLAL
jgi:hypothetical protein